MANLLKLEVVTPERRVVDDQATAITIPGATGYLGILPGHSPLITEVAIGQIAYLDAAGVQQRLAVAWGFAEVLPDKVTVLAETAEKASEIDVNLATQAKERAEAAIKAAKSDEDVSLQLKELARAVNQLEVAKDWRPPDVLP